MRWRAWIPLLVGIGCLWAVTTTLLERGARRGVSVLTGPPQLQRLFPTVEGPSPARRLAACMYASPVRISHQGQVFILLTPYDGHLTALLPSTDEVAWSLRLPLPAGLAPFIVATPVQIKDKLVLAYQTRSTETWQRVDHRVTVLDLNTRAVDTAYPELILTAQKPTADGSGRITLNPPTAHIRSLVHASSADRAMGYVYVSFGNPGDIQPWHGWVFEIDLDAWKTRGSEAAVSSVLLTTPEADCGDKKYGDRDTVCGGGVWTPTGPLVSPKEDGFELLIPVGNGQLDLQRQDYAQSLLRVGPGLDFDPGCDDRLCANFDQRDPDHACLRSCKNLFIPRLLPDDPPLRPASGRCDDKTFMECLAWLDADLGANAPVKAAVPEGPSVYVQPGKEGGVYLIDAEHLGTLYDRAQIVDLCGTPEDSCRQDWGGMIVTQPVLTAVAGVPTVIVPTFMLDQSQPAGLVALRIMMKDGRPQFEPFWQAPDFSTAEAIQTFRHRPSLAALSSFGGEEYIWIVDVNSGGDGKGTLLGVRVSDGSIIARHEMAGRGQRFTRPLVHDNTLYVSSCQNDVGPSHLEAYALRQGSPDDGGSDGPETTLEAAHAPAGR